MDDEVDEVVAEFLIESYDDLDKLDGDFIALAERRDDPELLAGVFRAMHTIKGTCGFLGFAKLEALAHAGESLLARLRDRSVTLDEVRTTALLAMVDAVRTMLRLIESTGSDGDETYTELIAELGRLAASAPLPAPTGPAHPIQPTTEVRPTPVPAPQTGTPTPIGAPCDGPAQHEVMPMIGARLVEAGVAEVDEIELALHEQDLGDGRRLGDILAAHGVASPDQIESAIGQQEDDLGEAGGRSCIADSKIRVDVARLDRLVDLVGELVLSRNNILQEVATSGDRNLGAIAQHLDLITSDLQEHLMRTRMQPVGSAWAKMPRIVREVAHACGKQVRLEMVGAETELDKSVIEAIRDPLTHLVRNAIDHGIEPPEVRAGRGKTEEGLLLLRASHEGGQVVIEIVDDGGGIDPEEIRRKAVARGVITAEAAAALSDREAMHLIFLAGFSTVDEVSAVSGRGVGLDVVKTKVEEIGGTVDVTSRAREGSTVIVRIPLTLAIVPALFVGCGGERFAIPEINVVELVQLRSNSHGSGIEMVHNAPVYRRRGRLLRLVDLHAVLQLTGDAHDRRTLAVVQADGCQFGVLVDEVVEAKEILVKPLSKLLSSVPLFAGATIMGDGHVALILDELRLGQQTRVLAAGTNRTNDMGRTGTAPSTEGTSMLLVTVGDRRAALRLDHIARLERFAVHALERRGQQQVVQYHGEIMPIVELGRLLSTSTPEHGGDEVTVVVCGHGPHVGLLVDAHVDICAPDERNVADPRATTMVLDGRVTEVVDVLSVLAEGGVDPEPALHRCDEFDRTAHACDGALA